MGKLWRTVGGPKVHGALMAVEATPLQLELQIAKDEASAATITLPAVSGEFAP